MSHYTDEDLIEREIREFVEIPDTGEDSRGLRRMVRLEMKLRMDCGAVWERTDLKFEDFVYSSTMCEFRHEMLRNGEHWNENVTEAQALAWAYAYAMRSVKKTIGDAWGEGPWKEAAASPA